MSRASCGFRLDPGERGGGIRMWGGDSPRLWLARSWIPGQASDGIAYPRASESARPLRGPDQSSRGNLGP